MKEKIGMYNDSPRVRIGKYTICQQSETSKSLWIEEEGKEGFEILESMMEPHIKQLFDVYM